MKIYTIIGGVNGVGKSSLTGVLSAESNDLGIIVDTETDENAAFEHINKSIDMGVNFTQETTLSGVCTLNTIKKAIDHGYYIRLYYIGVDTAEESIKRIRNRVEKGGHNILPEDVMRRYNKRFDDLNAVLPYCSEVHLFDNENGFSEIGEYKNGKLIFKTDRLPAWAEELKNHGTV